MTKNKYSKTILACYLGNITQAVVINLTPVLFIPLREQFGLSYEQLGLLILVNFITQVAVDILASGLVERFGYRIFSVTAHVVDVLGFVLFASSPFLFPQNPYIGFLAGTIVFSAGGGLLELLLSPIVNGLPTDGTKSTAMSLLHGFYAWGQVATVLLTTLFLFVFGREHWQLIMLLWMVIPVFNTILFSVVPLGSPVPETGNKTPVKKLLRIPFFLVALVTIAAGGASELCISQWSSAFFEKAAGMPKVMGDILGMTFFSVMFGLARTLHGVYGQKLDLGKLMTGGALLAIACYLTIALCPFSSIEIVACGLCGIAVALMWPGTLVLTAGKFPLAGASMFAIMAAGGDIGASVGPWFLSVITERVAASEGLLSFFAFTGLTAEQLALRAGVLVCVVFPIVCLGGVLWMRRHMDAVE